MPWDLNERSYGGSDTSCHRGRHRHGRWIRPALRARASRRLTCDSNRTQEARHCAPEAGGGRTSRLRGWLRTRRATLGSGRSGLLHRRLYRGSAGRSASQDNRGLHDRVRASSARQQPRRGVLILERGWRGPDGTKSDRLGGIQGRGRAGATGGGVPLCVHLPTRVHLPGRAAEGAEFWLPPVARNLPCVSRAVPQPGNSRRGPAPCPCGWCRPAKRGVRRSGFGEPCHSRHGRRVSEALRAIVHRRSYLSFSSSDFNSACCVGMRRGHRWPNASASKASPPVMTFRPSGVSESLWWPRSALSISRFTSSAASSRFTYTVTLGFGINKASASAAGCGCASSSARRNNSLTSIPSSRRAGATSPITDATSR